MVGFQTSWQAGEEHVEGRVSRLCPSDHSAGGLSTSLTHAPVFLKTFSFEMNFDLQKSCQEGAHFSASLNVHVNIWHTHRDPNHEISRDAMAVTIDAINESNYRPNLNFTRSSTTVELRLQVIASVSSSQWHSLTLSLSSVTLPLLENPG